MYFLYYKGMNFEKYGTFPSDPERRMGWNFFPRTIPLNDTLIEVR